MILFRFWNDNSVVILHKRSIFISRICGSFRAKKWWAPKFARKKEKEKPPRVSSFESSIPRRGFRRCGSSEARHTRSTRGKAWTKKKSRTWEARINERSHDTAPSKGEEDSFIFATSFFFFREILERRWLLFLFHLTFLPFFFLVLFFANILESVCIDVLLSLGKSALMERSVGKTKTT